MNREALYAVLESYLAALACKDASAVPWASDARHSENNVMLEPGDGVWQTIERLGDYRLIFADTRTGGVGYFGTVIEPREESAFTLRLKVNDAGEVTESEMVIVRNSDSGLVLPNPRFWTKPILEADAEAPVSREEMIRLSNGYFETLELNDGEIHTRFHPDCDRVENGFQSTNNHEADFMPTTRMGCEEQFALGWYRYDDRLRGRRFPLVDEERGIVLAHGFIDHCGALDRYQLTNGEWVDSFIRRPHTFYLAEIFKIDHGMIRQIEANFITVPYHMKSPWDGQ
ncbi:hypothetical protein [Altererythrobacter sp.]|uniref:hypothetical protein n=1 Tax=Altererythrobacter sp. TaxID=1872480 RepID=UPI003D0ECD3C